MLMFMTQNLNVETFWIFEFTDAEQGKFKTSKSIVEDDIFLFVSFKEIFKIRKYLSIFGGQPGLVGYSRKQQGLINPHVEMISYFNGWLK